MLAVRLCSAVLSAYIFTVYMPNPAFSFWRLTSCSDSWGDGCDAAFAWYERLKTVFRVVGGLLWVAAWILLEVRAHGSSARQSPRLLSHLRYGPAAVLLLSVGAVVATDQLAIQYSRRQIVRYIQGDAPPLEEPSLELYNDYRGWCGNGLAAREYELYGATPAAYYEDPDPAVRARAVHACARVYDRLNYPAAGPAWDVLVEAKNDPDPLVRKIAADHLR